MQFWITYENEFTHSFLPGVQEDFDFDDPMVVSSNYKIVVRYIAPDFDREVVKFIFEYHADTASEVGERREAISTTGESSTEYSLDGYITTAITLTAVQDKQLLLLVDVIIIIIILMLELP